MSIDPLIFRRPAASAKLFCWLGDDMIAVVVKPIDDQRADRAVVLIVQQCCVVEGSNQARTALKEIQQVFVVDIEVQRSRGSVG